MKRYLILKNYRDDEMELKEGRTYRFFKNYQTGLSLQKIEMLVKRRILKPLDTSSEPPLIKNHNKIEK